MTIVKTPSAMLWLSREALLSRARKVTVTVVGAVGAAAKLSAPDAASMRTAARALFALMLYW